MIRVVNRYRHIITEYDVYIGRGSLLGNPFIGTKTLSQTKALYQCNSREESIESFGEYLLNAVAEKHVAICYELNRIWKLAQTNDVNLVCFCSPQACHGDVIKQLIESKLYGN